MTTFREQFSGHTFVQFLLYFPTRDKDDREIDEDLCDEWVEKFAMWLEVDCLHTTAVLYIHSENEMHHMPVHVLRLLCEVEYTDEAMDEFQKLMNAYLLDTNQITMRLEINNSSVDFNGTPLPSERP